MQYLHNDGVLLIFHPKDLKWTKELSKYFFSYISRLFMNLRLVWIHFVSPIIAIQTKQLVSQVIFIIFSFILINHICVYYSLIFFVVSFILHMLCRPSSSLQSYLFDLSVILLDWNTSLCLFKWISTKIFRGMVWIWMMMFYTISRMLAFN